MKSILLIKMYLGLVELTFGLVYASFRLPEWLALKMTFFPPCIVIEKFRMCQYLYGYNQNNVQMMMTGADDDDDDDGRTDQINTKNYTLYMY